jgi:hypothetical protein
MFRFAEAITPHCVRQAGGAVISTAAATPRFFLDWLQVEGLLLTGAVASIWSVRHFRPKNFPSPTAFVIDVPELIERGGTAWGKWSWKAKLASIIGVVGTGAIAKWRYSTYLDKQRVRGTTPQDYFLSKKILYWLLNRNL